MSWVEDDPFAAFLRPPPNESAAKRAQRLAQEAEAKKVNDRIDDQLKAERAALRKQKHVVRVLLLGQSESGKSTTLKNFRMRYARDAWNVERASWRAVIQLNLIRSIILIIETLQAEIDGEPVPVTLTSNIPTSTLTTNSGVVPPNLDKPPNFSRCNAPSHFKLSAILNANHKLLKLRLAPLRRVESDLQFRLGEAAAEERDGSADEYGPLGFVPRQRNEFGVRKLHEALGKVSVRQEIGKISNSTTIGNPLSGKILLEHKVDEPTEVLAGCLDDMKALWNDRAVRVVLQKRKVHLEETAGFFLDDLDRVARLDYEPTDDDVIRARLRTVAPQEYRINITQSFFEGGDLGREWLLYDVGGSRTMRNAWIPFFDNVQAIIFLAPVSCFDERLSEDCKVNRLEDSFLLWRSLLGGASIVLFLNKCDLLKKKLRGGVLFNNYLPSYGERPNDFPAVIQYLGGKFKEILRQNSPEARSSYVYATTVIDTKATASTINAVKEGILRDYLRNANLV